MLYPYHCAYTFWRQQDSVTSCRKRWAVIPDVTWGIPSTPQVDQVHSKRAHRGWGLKTEGRVTSNPCWTVQLSESVRGSLPMRKSDGEPRDNHWRWQRRQPLSLYPLRDHVLTFPVHAVLTLLDLFLVLVNTFSPKRQPHLRSASMCLCSVHIQCSNVILEDNCAFLNNFWEEDSILHIDSSPSCTPTYAANSANNAGWGAKSRSLGCMSQRSKSERREVSVGWRC